MFNLLKRLQQKPLLGDGAMGTLLFARGIPFSQCLEALVIEQPDLIASIHEAYARAGADLLTTHTFGANQMRLALHGLEAKVRDLNLAAVELAEHARRTTGRDVLIAGNVGPVGRPVAWHDPAEVDSVAEAFREQIAALVDGGVDLLLFETFSDVDELEVSVRVAKEIGTQPIVASMSFGEDGLTLAGNSAGEVVKRLVAAGVDVIGANCGVGPSQMVEIVRAMRNAAPDALLSATPNAGLPILGDDGEMGYPTGPTEFAATVPDFLALGVRLIGGCCGTTVEHIAAMCAVLDNNAA